MHAKLEEKIVVVANRDGGLETMEVTGMLSLRISDDALAKIRMQLHNTPNKAIQLQTHPNIDKELLKTRSQVRTCITCTYHLSDLHHLRRLEQTV